MDAAPLTARHADEQAGPVAARRVVLVVIAWVALAAVIAGFAGLDPKLYEFSETLNRPGVPDPTDFYHRTAWFWDLARWPAHWTAMVAAVSGLAMWHPRGPRVAAATLAAYLLAAILIFVAQSSIGRLRPNQAKVVAANTGGAYHVKFEGPKFDWSGRSPYCFPSGEATASFALAAALSIALPRWLAVWISFATLTCAARMVGGAHYLSDVSAGAMVGIVCAATAFHVLDRRPAPTG